jgi:hypothetical protein
MFNVRFEQPRPELAIKVPSIREPQMTHVDVPDALDLAKS